MSNFLSNVLATKPVVLAVLAAVTLAFLSMAISESKAATQHLEDYTLTVDKWIMLDGEPAEDYIGQTFNVQVELTTYSSTFLLGDKFVFDMPGTMTQEVFADALYDEGESEFFDFPWEKMFWTVPGHSAQAIGLASAVIYSSNSWLLYDVDMRACVGGDIGIGCGSLTLGAPDVTAVPVPATIWLFGSALAGMGLIARRRQRKTSEI